MSWRVVMIRSRAKLECRMDYLVCRAERETRVHLSEIAVIIVENTAVSLTASLIAETAKRKIKLIFCDEKHNPISENTVLYGAYDTSGCVRKQTQWSEGNKLTVWTYIVRAKIAQQKSFLTQLQSDEASALDRYLQELEWGDETNREGLAAKVYFGAVFGQSFTRGYADSVNNALNYGYAILLSAFNREITAQGYLTQLGVFHRNEQNEFNLSCDFMEPFRVVVDRYVYASKDREFNAQYRSDLANLLNTQVRIGGKLQYVTNAVRIYTAGMLAALNTGDCGGLSEYEFSIYENYRLF